MFKPKTENIESFLPDEPSRKNYFLDKGFSDLGATIRESFQTNSSAAKKSMHAVGDAVSNTFSKNAVVRFASGLMHLLAAIAVITIGTILTLLLSVAHSFVLMAIMIVVYVLLAISKSLDYLYIKFRRVSVVCDQCKTRSDLPGYRCPACGKTHYRLRPNVYGIFYHVCECEQKLPAAFFVRTKNPATKDHYRRKKLESVCRNPHCKNMVYSKETTPLCIPVAGSRSVGKTAFITAVSHCLIEDVLPDKQCNTDYYNSEKKAAYAVIASDYARGETSMTLESANEKKPSAVSMSFFIQHDRLRPDRLLHVFDIAGETFVGNAEHERQLHYSYSDGIIFIVDPMAIPDVRDERLDRLNAVDTASMGKEDLNKVLSSFVLKIQDANALLSNQAVSVPFAVVINKIDQAGLSEYFDDDAAVRYKQAHPECPEVDVQDGLCRQFMLDHDMGNFLNTITIKFKVNRYFACSAIGHSRGAGSYSPQGVLSPVNWIFSRSDRALANVLNVESFPKVPYAAKMEK